MKAGLLIPAIAAAAVIGGGVYWGRGLVTADNNDAQAAVYAVPERRTIASTVLATGLIRLRVGAEVRVGSQLSGIVEELNVIVGSKIKQGDVLAKMFAGQRVRAGGAPGRSRVGPCAAIRL
jgi:multidrug efflux pump subunit AcrA (membrane-fusion protein)